MKQEGFTLRESDGYQKVGFRWLEGDVPRFFEYSVVAPADLEIAALELDSLANALRREARKDRQR